MANYLVIFTAPRSHVEFMRTHRGTSRNYYAGEPPDFRETEPKRSSFLDRVMGRHLPASSASADAAKVPADWPQSEAKVADIEINHRNVDLYHRILNKTSTFVVGSGSIFQTWLHAEHDAIPLDDDNEDFAFLPEQLPELLALVESVTPESLLESFQEWCRDEGKDHQPTIEEATEMHSGFVSFANYLQRAIERHHGLVWVVS